MEQSWTNILHDYINNKSFKETIKRVRLDYSNKKERVYPAYKNIFKAFNETPFDKVRVVILGQDPYYKKGQANGLSFSVPKDITAPPTLSNIFKEIKADIGSINTDTDLSHWAQQGVLLLNSILTVKENDPGSHSNIGWVEFTDYVINKISKHKEHVVFILWGNYAKSKKTLINQDKHLVLESSHPSPLSAYRGFLGCKHFSKANDYLKQHHADSNIINW